MSAARDTEDSGSGRSNPQSDSSARTATRGDAGAPRRADGTTSRKKESTLSRTVIEIVVIIVAAFAIAMLVQFFLVKPFTIHQVSMRPTLQDGDRILLSRVTYRFRSPRSGDVVVFHSPINPGEDLVKRVVAVAGDTVAVHDGYLYVNGVAKTEPYLLQQHFSGTYAARLIPAGYVFVMGDNRNNSGDSRLFGPIPVKSIIGKAFFVYWPLNHWKVL